MYNVTLRHFRIATVAVENEWVLNTMSLPLFLPYLSAIQITYLLRRVVYSSGCTIFSTLYDKWHNIRKKIIEHKMCDLVFSTNFVWNISYSKNNLANCYRKCAVGLRVK